MAKIVAIINMKGGVGKTTLAWNLANNLFDKHGKKVLIVDMDPQANATLLGLTIQERESHYHNKKTVADFFINCYRKYGPFHKPVFSVNYDEFIFNRKTSNTGARLDLIPSEMDLSWVLMGTYVNPFALEEALNSTFFNQYDYILIDCPPTNSILTTLSLNASKKVLVPVMADTFAVQGVELMKKVIKEHEEDYQTKIGIVGLAFVRYKDKANQTDQKTLIVRAWGTTTFAVIIHENEHYKIANGNRVTIEDSAAHQPVKDEFDDFTDEFIQKT